jgi:H+-transporting ATPase
MISMKLSTPVFLALGVIFLGAFVLAPLQIVLLMLLGNFVTMSVSMDQVDASPLPDRWAIAPLMTAGAGLAALALLFNLTLFWLATMAFRLDTGARQTYIFFWLLIGAGQALLYVTRNRGFFWERPFPGRLHLAITLAEVGALALLATQGWLMAPIPVSLLGGLLVLVLIFLVLADLLKIGLMRGARSPVRQPASFTAS